MTIDYWPLGVEDDKFEVNANIDWRNLEGSNQVRGDGRSSVNANHGRAIRGSIEVCLPKTWCDADGAEISVAVSESGKDRIIVTHEGVKLMFNVKRVIRRDQSTGGTQTILCVRPKEFAAQMTQQRQG